MKTILVPTDFSDSATNALDFARQLALAHDMEVNLLHVVEQASAPYMTAVSGGMHDQLGNVFVLKVIERAKAQLELIVNELSNVKVKASYQIKIGNPYRKISNYIKSETCDLIVMGTRGVSGIDEVLVGSNTEKVVRHAQVPVITIKQPILLEDIKELVFAMSYSEDQEYLAWELKDLQRMFNARLHLVTINTPGSFVSDRHGMKYLLEFAQQQNLQNYTVNIYSDLVEEDGIRHFAEDHQADLIAMATHGRTGINHLLSGSLSEQVVNHVDLPVVTFPIKLKPSKPLKDVVL